MTQQPSSQHALDSYEPQTSSARKVAVLSVGGPRHDVAADLDRAIQLALAGGPCGVLAATSEVPSTPTLGVESLRLAPHPTAPRASRNFVTRTLLDWQLSRAIPFACLVVSELVSSSSVNAGTDIDVSVGWDRGALRIAVQDGGPALPGQRPVFDLHGRGLTVVAGLSRAFGVLPTGEGDGKVVWAVLDAPRAAPRPSEHSTDHSSRRAAGADAFAL